jgi:hypothetical protein
LKDVDLYKEGVERISLCPYWSRERLIYARLKQKDIIFKTAYNKKIIIFIGKTVLFKPWTSLEDSTRFDPISLLWISQ